MAILHAPRPHPPAPVRSAPAASVPSSAGRARDGGVAPSRAERLAQWGPIVALSLVACFSVGYGIGSIAQFDHDWRDGALTRVAVATGPAPVGQALDTTVASLLEASAAPVTAVQCPGGVVVTANLPSTVCRARSADRMVSVVAAAQDGRLQVAAYSAG